MTLHASQPDPSQPKRLSGGGATASPHVSRHDVRDEDSGTVKRNGPGQDAPATDRFGGLPAAERDSAAADRSVPLGGWPKRAIDIVVASTALVLASPLMAVIALVIWATSGRPVLFAHSRVGFKGEMFKCYKFRTMVSNADAALEALLASDPAAAKEWMEQRKLKRDPRVTFFGRILRLSSLDELPQLFNVLLGDMSCVGPRPIVVDELQRYGTYASDYLRVRPGVTGAWQVFGRDDVDYARRVSLDSYYVRNWSIRYDLVILFWTIFAVMRFDRAS
jgi:exopolysaccharide production protein ExoY